MTINRVVYNNHSTVVIVKIYIPATTDVQHLRNGDEAKKKIPMTVGKSVNNKSFTHTVAKQCQINSIDVFFQTRKKNSNCFSMLKK